MSSLLQLFSDFRRDRRGNIAVIFAITCVPLISSVGCAVEYSHATQIKAKLQAAADAASVGSVARNSPAYLYAGTMTSDGPISVGVTDATNIFNANMHNLTDYTLNSVTPVVQKTGLSVTSTVSYSATMQTLFLGIIGKSTMTMSGSSTSGANMPLYIDFYLLLDNSPSMGVGATPTDVQTMVSNTPDQCAFACHDVSNSNNYYNLAKSLGVTMRIDVLRSATQQLMDTASSTETYSNQFRMAIYDFGITADTAALSTVFPLSTNLSSAKTAAGSIDLMTVNGQNDNNDQDTAFDTVLPQINLAISNPGTGVSGSPQKYLFFVSDGVTDEVNASCLYTMTNPTWGNIAPRCQEPINVALCTSIKARGIKIAVLYTTYNQLPTNSWYMSWIDPFNAGPWGPSPNSTIAQNMQSCASTGLYFEVSPTQGISSAMTALFQKAVADARLSQ